MSSVNPNSSTNPHNSHARNIASAKIKKYLTKQNHNYKLKRSKKYADFKPTPKQEDVLKYLCDEVSKIILFGGGVGGAKTFLGCAYIILLCQQLPGIRIGIFRKTLKSLERTTLNTFLDIVYQWNLETYINYNAKDKFIEFSNGSVVYLSSLDYTPSQPNYEYLSGLELSFAFVDEAQEVTGKAISVLYSRIRYKLDEFGLIPKILLTCNPSKNYLYHDFYVKWKNNTLEKGKVFIQALAKDNPHLPKSYIESLENSLDPISKRQLLYGEWEFESRESHLIEYDKIIQLFVDKNQKLDKELYLSIDVARMGKDLTVIMLWNEYRVEKMWIIPKADIETQVDFVKDIIQEYKLKHKNIVIDDDGVGGGLGDFIKGCYQFVNNSRPLHGENFSNLKSQCYWELARRINNQIISVNENAFIENLDTSIKDKIIQELEALQADRIESDAKLSVIPKEKMKSIIGRSPDFADCLMMRCVFSLTEKSAPSGNYNFLSFNL